MLTLATAAATLGYLLKLKTRNVVRKVKVFVLRRIKNVVIHERRKLERETKGDFSDSYRSITVELEWFEIGSREEELLCQR